MENRYSSPGPKFSVLSSTCQMPYSRNSVLSNISNTFQRSQISTSRSKNQENRNKSKIKALPNYKPQNLSGTMPFVTIFQSIQIQRLSEEIEVQRARLHEAQKQAFNAINYQVQIQELSQKCTSYQTQIKQYQDQLGKMNKICESLYHENQNLKINFQDGIAESQNIFDSTRSINAKQQLVEVKKILESKEAENKQLLKDIEKWTSKYQESQNNKQRQMEAMKQIMEAQRRSMLDRQIKDLEAKHQVECANLAMQLKKINYELELKDNQIEDLKIKAKNADDYIKELQQYGNKLSEYQQKISLLNNEHMRLSQIVDNSSVQLNNARKKEFQLTQQIQTDKQIILDNNYLKSILQAKQKQIDNWKNNIVALEEQISKGRELYLLNQELEAKNGFLKEENIRANNLLKDRYNDIEKWKKMALSLESQVSIMKQKELKHIDCENKEKILRVQNQRILGLLKVKTNQVQELKEKYRNSENSLSALSRVERELKTCQQKYRTQVERNRNLENYIEELEGSKTFSATCQLKTQQLSDKLQFSEKQSQNLRKTISALENELMNCKKIQSRLSAEQLQLKKQYLSNKQNEQKIALLSQQIQRLNQLLRSKNIEITKLEEQQLQKFNVINDMKKLEIQLIQKQNSQGELKDQLERALQRVRQCQIQIVQIQHTNNSKINDLNNRERNLSEKLAQKAKQYEKLSQNFSSVSKELKQNSNLERLCQKQQNRITVYQRDIQNLKEERSSLEGIANQQMLEIRQLKETISKLEHKSRMDRLATSQANRDSENSSMKFSSKITKSAQEDQIEKLLSKVSLLQNIVIDLKQKYEILLSSMESTASKSEVSEFSCDPTSNQITISRVSSYAR